MKNIQHKRDSQRGFGLIEAVVSVAIFVLISMTLYELFGSVLKSIRNDKAILAANSLALEKLELVRGMEFNSVGTQLGFVPAGPLPNSETVVRGGTSFTVRTDISWVDDPFDGCDNTCGAGGNEHCSAACTEDADDAFAFDYKKVRVRVSWTTPVGGGSSEIAMSTNVVPPGMEGLSEGKGGLYIMVFDADGEPVAEAEVSINSVAADYVLTPATGGRTDLNGNLWVPELEPANDYHISVTKGGFSTAETYAADTDPASPDYNPNPAKPDATVVAQQAVKIGFQIDEVGSLNIKTVRFQNPGNWRVNAATDGEQTQVASARGADGHLYAAWTGLVGVEQGIYLMKLSSVSGGFARDWSDVRIVQQTGASSPQLAVVGGALWAVWSDQRSGDGDIYLRRLSTADGSALGGELLVSHAAAGTHQTAPSLAAGTDGNLYIAWEDDRDGSWDIYAQRFTPSAGAFWPSDLKLNGAAAGEQLSPVLAAGAAGGLYGAWQSNAAGNFDILLRAFDTDGNPLWAEKTVNTDGSSLDQYDPSLALGGGNLYLAWSDDRNSQPDIYLQKAAADGTNLLPADVKINDDAYATARRVRPAVAYHSDSQIYVTWEDDRNGATANNIYASLIDASAARQWTFDLIVADEIMSLQHGAVTLCDAAGAAITLWADNRDGDSDLYGSVYESMGNYAAANVPVTVLSEKAKGTYGDPPVNIPKYQQVFTTDGAGLRTVAGLEWGGYNFEVGGGWSVVSFDLPAPIVMAPAGSASVIINVSN